MIMKNDLEELVRERLKLPDNAVIVTATFKIDNTDEIYITGDTEVVFPGPTTVEDALIAAAPARGKRGGRRKREQGNTIRKQRQSDEATPAGGHALPGKGAKITDAQVKGMKAVLHSRKSLGKLSDSQLMAMKSLDGVRVGKMSPEMRQQLKDICEATNPPRY